MRNYLFLVSLTYGFPILRPLQKAIRSRGDCVAWFFDNPGMSQFLKEDEIELKSVDEVMELDPIAVFTAGDHMYDFFPGVKVQLFHGFGINKRIEKRDSHFFIRGWFDLYCTQGDGNSIEFKKMEREYGHFKVVETGWSKIDNFYGDDGRLLTMPPNKRATVLYSSTFSKRITSTTELFDTIEHIIKSRDWDWLITFHPMMAADIVERYKALAQRYSNVTFYESDNNVELLLKADVMVCDSSSIIIEFLALDKPVVTFKNTQPGDFLIDIDDPTLLESSIEKALQRPEKLMANIKKYIDYVNPYYDGRSSYRVLEAVDALVTGELGAMKRKPANYFRKWKMRRKLNYFPILHKKIK